MVHQRLRAVVRTALCVFAALVVLGAVTGCESGLFAGAERTPTSAQFLEKGTACEVVVYFNNSVKNQPASKPSYYRLSTGEYATDTADVPDVHAVIVTFPAPVTTADLIAIGADTSNETILAVTTNTADAEPAEFVDASFVADAAAPVVALSFDGALDATVASDVTRYALQGTIEHPISAEMTDCGQKVELTFAALKADTRLDFEGLTDLNGVPVEDRLGLTVAAAEEETRPVVESAAFAVDGAYATAEVTFSEAIDQTTAETVANYTLMPEGTAPAWAAVKDDGRTVAVVFSEIRPPITLNVKGVTDLAKNPMMETSGIEVNRAEDSTPPMPVAASPTGRNGGLTVEVTFNEAVTPNTAELVTNYVLSGPQEPATLQPTAADVVDEGSAVALTFDYVPADGTLEVSGISDLNGNVMADSAEVAVDFTYDRTAPAVSTATFVANSTTPAVDVAFDQPMLQTSVETVTNYTFSTGAVPLSATLQSDQRTVRLVTTSLARTTTLAIANVVDASGNIVVAVANAAINAAADSTEPLASSVAYLDDTSSPTVLVTYSEAVDETSAETVSNYLSTTDSQAPDTAVMQSDGRTVELTFGPMPLGTQLKISGVVDLDGNAIATVTMDIAADADTTSPTVVSAQFLADAGSPTVEVEFSEAVNETLAEAPALYLMGTARTSATLATLQDDGRTVRVVFPAVARADKLEIRSITDMSGNAITAVSDLTVDSAEDDNHPRAISGTFAANGTTPTVTLEFSEAVDKTSAETLTNYTRVRDGAHPTSATVQSDGRSVALVFSSLASSDSLLTENVSDFAGNKTTTTVDVPLTANSETTAPTISSATVSGVHEITIVFSEVVDRTSALVVTNYTGLPTGASASSTSIATDGRTVTLTTIGVHLSAGDQFDVAGVKDLNGNTMTAVTDYTTS